MHLFMFIGLHSNPVVSYAKIERQKVQYRLTYIVTCRATQQISQSEEKSSKL